MRVVDPEAIKNGEEHDYKSIHVEDIGRYKDETGKIVVPLSDIGISDLSFPGDKYKYYIQKSESVVLSSYDEEEEEHYIDFVLERVNLESGDYSDFVVDYIKNKEEIVHDDYENFPIEKAGIRKSFTAGYSERSLPLNGMSLFRELENINIYGGSSRTPDQLDNEIFVPDLKEVIVRADSYSSTGPVLISGIRGVKILEKLKLEDMSDNQELPSYLIKTDIEKIKYVEVKRASVTNDEWLNTNIEVDRFDVSFNRSLESVTAISGFRKIKNLRLNGFSDIKNETIRKINQIRYNYDGISGIENISVENTSGSTKYGNVLSYQEFFGDKGNQLLEKINLEDISTADAYNEDKGRKVSFEFLNHNQGGPLDEVFVEFSANTRNSIEQDNGNIFNMISDYNYKNIKKITLRRTTNMTDLTGFDTYLRESDGELIIGADYEAYRNKIYPKEMDPEATSVDIIGPDGKLLGSFKEEEGNKSFVYNFVGGVFRGVVIW